MLSRKQPWQMGLTGTLMYDENYASLRPHLRPEVVKQLEGQTIHMVLGGPAFPRTLIIEEIACIEKKWNLV